MSGKLRVLVEGWRFLEQSFSLAGQWQCLMLMRRPDIDLRYIERPLHLAQWKQRRGIFRPEQEQALADMKEPADGETFDVNYRIDYPYNLQPSDATVALMFATAEYRTIFANSFKAPPDKAAIAAEPRFGIITPARWNVEAFLNLGFPPERIQVVPLGFDPTIFRQTPGVREQTREKLGLKGFLFMTAGAMTQNKGIDLLIQAFAAVAQKRPDVYLLLKGADQLYRSKEHIQNYLKLLSTELQQLVQSRLVYVTGALSNQDMAALYQAADTYVSSYLAEGFNIPVLEATACGLPVICSDGGPTDDFTDPAFTKRIRCQLKLASIAGQQSVVGQYLVPDRDHLIELMLNAVDDAAWRTLANTEGAAFAHKNFTWERSVDRLVQAFHQAKNARQ
jgi:glycosyltransferase involved in cell wall biosynthesis